MNKTYVLALAAALFAMPLTYAHVDGLPYGLPKLYCEDSPLAGDQITHDYAPPASGFLILLGSDWSTPMGLYPLLPGGCAYAADIPNQWDGHYEHAFGGAWLLACASACGDGTGAGAEVCFGTYADHSEFPTVWVFDHVLSTAGADVTFSIFADTVSLIPPFPGDPNCGDFEADFGVECVNQCTVPFPAGLDGSYQVYVCGGSLGHIWTGGFGPAASGATAGGCGAGPPECNNNIDDDGDGYTDYHGGDPGCTHPGDRTEAEPWECGYGGSWVQTSCYYRGTWCTLWVWPTCVLY